MRVHECRYLCVSVHMRMCVCVSVRTYVWCLCVCVSLCVGGFEISRRQKGVWTSYPLLCTGCLPPRSIPDTQGPFMDVGDRSDAFHLLCQVSPQLSALPSPPGADLIGSIRVFLAL